MIRCAGHVYKLNVSKANRYINLLAYKHYNRMLLYWGVDPKLRLETAHGMFYSESYYTAIIANGGSIGVTYIKQTFVYMTRICQKYTNTDTFYLHDHFMASPSPDSVHCPTNLSCLQLDLCDACTRVSISGENKLLFGPLHLIFKYIAMNDSHHYRLHYVDKTMYLITK